MKTTKLQNGIHLYAASMNPADKWMDGQISAAKMLDTYGVPRPCGDDLVGHIWHAMNDRLSLVKDDLQRRIDRAEKDKAAALAEGKADDATCEAVRCRAFTEALTQLRLHFGGAVDRTGAHP